MKPVKKQKPKKEAPQKPTLPAAQISFDSESSLGKIWRKKYFGRFSSLSTVIFSLSLPQMDLKEFGETEAFLQVVAEEFLSFLEEKSQKEGEDAFGGLSFSPITDGFLIQAAFCPAKERNFLPAFSLTLSPEGKLVAVKK
ncbi:MAG: hypothetical protein IKT50_06065 [Clostridia bacterium]|nr:hypothetical protein [Clostridia bacterium]